MEGFTFSYKVLVQYTNRTNKVIPTMYKYALSNFISANITTNTMCLKKLLKSKHDHNLDVGLKSVLGNVHVHPQNVCVHVNLLCTCSAQVRVAHLLLLFCMYYFGYFMFFVVWVCVFHVWSLSMDYILLISTRILVSLITLYYMYNVQWLMHMHTFGTCTVFCTNTHVRLICWSRCTLICCFSTNKIKYSS